MTYYRILFTRACFNCSFQEVIKSRLQNNDTRWATILRSGKRYTGKAFYDRAAIEITCHDHSMLLRSARYYILFS